jgi:hypothetical protein
MRSRIVTVCLHILTFCFVAGPSEFSPHVFAVCQLGFPLWTGMDVVQCSAGKVSAYTYGHNGKSCYENYSVRFCFFVLYNFTVNVAYLFWIFWTTCFNHKGLKL